MNNCLLSDYQLCVNSEIYADFVHKSHTEFIFEFSES